MQLTEAEEECVDTHVVHTEEPMSDEVAPEHHRLNENRTRSSRDTKREQIPLSFVNGPLVTYNNWHPVIVEGFRAEDVAWQLYSSGEEEEGENTWRKK